MILNVDQLQGEQLNTAAAIALGYRRYPKDNVEQGKWWHSNGGPPARGSVRISKRDFDLLSPLNASIIDDFIQQEGISVFLADPQEMDGKYNRWLASAGRRRGAIVYGQTHKEAALRCYIALHLGHEIDLRWADELYEQSPRAYSLTDPTA